MCARAVFLLCVLFLAWCVCVSAAGSVGASSVAAPVTVLSPTSQPLLFADPSSCRLEWTSSALLSAIDTAAVSSLSPAVTDAGTCPGYEFDESTEVEVTTLDATTADTDAALVAHPTAPVGASVWPEAVASSRGASVVFTVELESDATSSEEKHILAVSLPLYTSASSHYRCRLGGTVAAIAPLTDHSSASDLQIATVVAFTLTPTVQLALVSPHPTHGCALAGAQARVLLTNDVLSSSYLRAGSLLPTSLTVINAADDTVPSSTEVLWVALDATEEAAANVDPAAVLEVRLLVVRLTPQVGVTVTNSSFSHPPSLDATTQCSFKLPGITAAAVHSMHWAPAPVDALLLLTSDELLSLPRPSTGFCNRNTRASSNTVMTPTHIAAQGTRIQAASEQFLLADQLPTVTALQASGARYIPAQSAFVIPLTTAEGEAMAAVEFTLGTAASGRSPLIASSVSVSPLSPLPAHVDVLPSSLSLLSVSPAPIATSTMPANLQLSGIGLADALAADPGIHVLVQPVDAHGAPVGAPLSLPLVVNANGDLTVQLPSGGASSNLAWPASSAAIKLSLSGSGSGGAAIDAGSLVVDIDECAVKTDSCPPNFACTNQVGGVACTACAAGATQSAANECSLCAVNTFKSSVGTAGCTACPAHTVSAAGSTSPNACLLPNDPCAGVTAGSAPSTGSAASSAVSAELGVTTVSVSVRVNITLAPSDWTEAKRNASAQTLLRMLCVASGIPIDRVAIDSINVMSADIVDVRFNFLPTLQALAEAAAAAGTNTDTSSSAASSSSSGASSSCSGVADVSRASPLQLSTLFVSWINDADSPTQTRLDLHITVEEQPDIAQAMHINGTDSDSGGSGSVHTSAAAAADTPSSAGLFTTSSCSNVALALVPVLILGSSAVVFIALFYSARGKQWRGELSPSARPHEMLSTFLPIVGWGGQLLFIVISWRFAADNAHLFDSTGGSILTVRASGGMPLILYPILAMLLMLLLSIHNFLASFILLFPQWIKRVRGHAVPPMHLWYRTHNWSIIGLLSSTIINVHALGFLTARLTSRNGGVGSMPWVCDDDDDDRDKGSMSPADANDAPNRRGSAWHWLTASSRTKSANPSILRTGGGFHSSLRALGCRSLLLEVPMLLLQTWWVLLVLAQNLCSPLLLLQLVIASLRLTGAIRLYEYWQLKDAQPAKRYKAQAQIADNVVEEEEEESEESSRSQHSSAEQRAQARAVPQAQAQPRGDSEQEDDDSSASRSESSQSRSHKSVNVPPPAAVSAAAVAAVATAAAAATDDTVQLGSEDAARVSIHSSGGVAGVRESKIVELLRKADDAVARAQLAASLAASDGPLPESVCTPPPAKLSHGWLLLEDVCAPISVPDTLELCNIERMDENGMPFAPPQFATYVREKRHTLQPNKQRQGRKQMRLKPLNAVEHIPGQISTDSGVGSSSSSAAAVDADADAVASASSSAMSPTARAHGWLLIEQHNAAQAQGGESAVSSARVVAAGPSSPRPPRSQTLLHCAPNAASAAASTGGAPAAAASPRSANRPSRISSANSSVRSRRPAALDPASPQSTRCVDSPLVSPTMAATPLSPAAISTGLTIVANASIAAAAVASSVSDLDSSSSGDESSSADDEAHDQEPAPLPTPPPQPQRAVSPGPVDQPAATAVSVAGGGLAPAVVPAASVLPPAFARRPNSAAAMAARKKLLPPMTIPAAPATSAATGVDHATVVSVPAEAIQVAHEAQQQRDDDNADGQSAAASSSACVPQSVSVSRVGAPGLSPTLAMRAVFRASYAANKLRQLSGVTRPGSSSGTLAVDPIALAAERKEKQKQKVNAFGSRISRF